MMRRSLIAITASVAVMASVAGVAGVAAADVTPPTGWKSNPDFAAALTQRNDIFGGLPATVTTEVYHAPIRGAVLYVTRAEAKVPAAQRDAAASYEIEELRRALERAGGAAKPLSQSQRVDPASKLVEGSLVWRDDPGGIATSRRVVIAADAERIIALTGECVLATDLAAEIGQACDRSLATLVPEIPVDRRVAISLVGPAAAAPVEPAPPAPSGAPLAATTARGSSTTGPGMSDASHLPPMQPIQVETPRTAKRETDRRPVWVGIGLVVLAILFYWNRKRRERFEREDARAAGVAASDDDARDDDSDLHAAAEAALSSTASDDDKHKKGDDDTN